MIRGSLRRASFYPFFNFENNQGGVYFMIDVSNEIKSILGEQQPKELRQSCLRYLKENILRIVKQKIELVYSINSFREQIIELPRFLEAVKIDDNGDWKFEIFIDENDLKFATEQNEEIYEIKDGNKVNNLNSIRELDFIKIESEKEAINFIKNNLSSFVAKIIRR